MTEQRGVVPGGESIRSALKWLSERRQAEASAAREKLIDEAALRFDLSPMDVDFLLNHWKES